MSLLVNHIYRAFQNNWNTLDHRASNYDIYLTEGLQVDCREVTGYSVVFEVSQCLI